MRPSLFKDKKRSIPQRWKKKKKIKVSNPELFFSRRKNKGERTETFDNLIEPNITSPAGL